MFRVGVSAGGAALLSTSCLRALLRQPPVFRETWWTPPWVFDASVQRVPTTWPYSHMSLFVLISFPWCFARILGWITRPPGRPSRLEEQSSFMTFECHASLYLVNWVYKARRKWETSKDRWAWIRTGLKYLSFNPPTCFSQMPGKTLSALPL